MRIKINDKIYRLKEIESGVDSLMELVEEPKYKDGDFVVNEAGSILIFKEKFGGFISDHAYLAGNLMLFTNSATTSCYGIKRYATKSEKQELLDALAKEGKRWNADKKCVEDIPVSRFKKGDKVRIKEGISSEKYSEIEPYFQLSMDDFIATTMTVNRYDDMYGYVICNESDCRFNEDWLEPYTDELKNGDLAIFWDSDQAEARIGVYNQFRNDTSYPHEDHIGNGFKNAVKFESKEQFKRFIKGKL